MNINIPQTYFSKLMRAVVEFELIDNGDRILIGVSGGKDSIFLTYALAILRERLKKDFTITAFTVNPQFDDPFDTDAIAAFCKSLDVPYEVVDVDIAGAIAEQEEKSPCFTCAFFRRGAVNRYAKEHHMNKVAYAHHHDDAVETFLMSLFYSGQLNTFRPKTYLDKTGITVIRPLVYFREQEIIDAIPPARLHSHPVAMSAQRKHHTANRQRAYRTPQCRESKPLQPPRSRNARRRSRRTLACKQNPQRDGAYLPRLYGEYIRRIPGE